MATVSTSTQLHPKTVPDRPAHFLFGSLLEFRRHQLNFFINAAREQGDVARYRFGPNV